MQERDVILTVKYTKMKSLPTLKQVKFMYLDIIKSSKKELIVLYTFPLFYLGLTLTNKSEQSVRNIYRLLLWSYLLKELSE